MSSNPKRWGADWPIISGDLVVWSLVSVSVVATVLILLRLKWLNLSAGAADWCAVSGRSETLSLGHCILCWEAIVAAGLMMALALCVRTPASALDANKR